MMMKLIDFYYKNSIVYIDDLGFIWIWIWIWFEIFYWIMMMIIIMANHTHYTITLIFEYMWFCYKKDWSAANLLPLPPPRKRKMDGIFA